MMFFQRVSDLYGVRLFSVILGLLILVAAHVPFTTGHVQQVGVSLKLHGVTIPNNSLVNLDDILYTAPPPYPCCNIKPSNSRPELHDGALLCMTDLEDCCDAPYTVRGNWYHPDGRTVLSDNTGGQKPAAFLINRGPNEVINGRQFYGSVRLFRRWGSPPERGRFRCELPSAADPNVNQTLYVSIVQFGSIYVHPVSISASGDGIAGTTFSLTCSSTLTNPIPLPANVPCPSFEWFYGPNGNASLPPGVIPVEKFDFSGHTFTSILQFTPGLNESHAGNYTCRLGAGRLVNSKVVSVDVAILQITTSEVPAVGRNQGYTLTCKALVADHLCPFVSYQWAKDNGTVTQPENDTIMFSPLRLSNAGRYTCQAIVCSIRFANEVTLMKSYEVRIQIPPPTSVIISTSSSNPVRPIKSAVNLTCTVSVELSPQANTTVILNIVWTGPTDGFTTINTSQPIMGSSITYTSTAMVSSLGRNESGTYTCTASLGSSTNLYLSNSTAISNSIQVTTGVYLALRNQFIANNTQINTRSVGLSSDNPDGAVQCITDRKPCCFSQDPRLGWWYQPDGLLVHWNTSGVVFHRNREDNGEVYLYRSSGATMTPTGQFCCVVPDATNRNQTLCVIIGRVSITAHGSPIAGESYSLECSAGESTVTFQWWLGPPDSKTAIANSETITISANSSTSRLQFQPVQQSHSDLYSCSAMTHEETLSSEPIDILVKVPSISVMIRISDHTSGIAGESYALNCRVFGTENLDPSITYQWMKSTNGGQMHVGTNSTLSFSPVRLSDAANYSCIITIASGCLINSITAMASQSVRIQIPTLSAITLRSNVANHSSIIIIGSDVTLTCAVELNSAILGSEMSLLMVLAQVSKDEGTLLALTGPIVTGSTFTYTTQLKSFEKNDFGNYTCIATVKPQPTSTYLTGTAVLSDTLIIKTVILPPVDVRATQSSPSAPVEVSWSPPSAQGGFNITEYRIFYGSGHNVSIPSVLITSVSFRVNGRYDGQTIAIRSESSQLFSELVNITVEINDFCTVCDTAKCSCKYSCSVEIGAAIGVIVVVMAITTVIIIVSFCWRRRNKKDIEVSVNVAYQKTTWKRSEDLETEREYESIDMIIESTLAEKTASEYTDIQKAISNTNTIQQP